MTAHTKQILDNTADPSAIHHVGVYLGAGNMIYTGAGNMIDAPIEALAAVLPAMMCGSSSEATTSR